MTSATDNRNYVAAWLDYRADKVVVLERDQSGALFRKRYSPPYYFYVPDEDGDYTSIFGDKLSRVEFESRDHYDRAKRHFPIKFESDIPPLKRVLMDYYYDRPTPTVNFAFLDIEVDYSQNIGFAGPTNPYAPINAVTVYQSWTKKFLTAAIPPKGWSGDASEIDATIKELIEQQHLRNGMIPEIHLCRDELELLNLMLLWIQESDIISGWNSEFYDIPYICERLLLAGGEQLLSRIEHIGVRPPKKEMVTRFGSEEPVWKFSGRCHLDYMRLFQKFTFEGRVSYALGNILQEEVGVGKLEYDGTLERLYNDDFATFVSYNFRDVDGLVQLDDKFKFIALANQMAHENTVLFDAVLGTVSYVETGITNHAHYKLGKIVHDKNIQEHDKVEGAIVMTPKIGLHDWVGSVDINSLYPNTIRSLNISPEKIIGQFTANEQAWADIRNGTNARHTLIFENGQQEVTTAVEWKELLSAHKWAVSAYGTVFDQSNGRGVVADILGFWYAERKRLQAEKKKCGKIAEELRKTLGMDLPAELKSDLTATAGTANVTDGKNKSLIEDGGRLYSKKELKQIKEAEAAEAHWDLLQLTKKISLNSAYGALLSPAFRFSDVRLGASVTATGRQITTHMIETIGEFLTGVRTPLVKTTTTDEDGKLQHEYTSESEAIIYGDTDSCYYKCLGAEDKASAVEIADLAAEGVNDSFPAFMREAFRCQPEFDNLIVAGREVVGVRGLFQAKKKYMIKIVDLEGNPVDKMKSMGSEIKKADTPKIIQSFLKTTVDMILDGEPYDSVAAFVNAQRKSILKQKINVFSLGVAKQVNNLDKYLAEYRNPGIQRTELGKKLTIPGHVRAACNYNEVLEHFDKGAKSIRSGDKVLIYCLKPNLFNFDTIAIPAESTKFPKWFDENFSVDIKKTEDKMFDNKLSGIFSALGKDVPSPQSVLTNSILSF